MKSWEIMLLERDHKMLDVFSAFCYHSMEYLSFFLIVGHSINQWIRYLKANPFSFLLYSFHLVLWNAILYDNWPFIISRSIWKLKKFYKKIKSPCSKNLFRRDLLFYEHYLRQKKAWFKRNSFKRISNLVFMEFFLRLEYTIKSFFNLRQECLFYNFLSFCYAFQYDLWKIKCYFQSLNIFSLQRLPNFRAKAEFWAKPSPTMTIKNSPFFQLC